MSVAERRVVWALRVEMCDWVWDVRVERVGWSGVDCWRWVDWGGLEGRVGRVVLR